MLRETGAEIATVLAERMRRAVEDAPFKCKRSRRDYLVDVIISVGVAELESHFETPDELLEEADRFLYRAKNAGRNRVESKALGA